MLARGRLAIMGFSGVISTKTAQPYYGLAKALAKDKKTKGVLLLIESPGGSATASEFLYEIFSGISAKKPVIAYCPLAASGGYMASLAATRIYAPHTAIIGSIGVISMKPVLKDLMDKAGVGVEIVKQGAMKDMGLFHRGYTEEERASMDELGAAVYDRFVSLIATSRRMDEAVVRRAADGRVFPAKKAVELGLIDGIKSFDEALDELSSQTKVKKERAFFVSPPKGILRRLTGL